VADILLIGIREENKADFIVEFIKGLMSRGLSVSYAGAYYSEIRNRFVYDNIVNLLFFSSTYFREAHMKSKNFGSWKGFLDDIDFEKIEERLIIYINTYQYRDRFNREYFKSLKESFQEYLTGQLQDSLSELIRDLFRMSFLSFRSHYPEVVQLLDINCKSLTRIRRQVDTTEVAIEVEKLGNTFYSFMTECRSMRKEIIKSGAREARDKLEREKEEDEIKELLQLDGEETIPKLYCLLEKAYDGLPDQVDDENLRRLVEAERRYIRWETEIIDKGRPGNGTFRDLERSRRNVEIECSRDSSKAEILLGKVFPPKTISAAAISIEKRMYFDIQNRMPRKKIICINCRHILSKEEKEVELLLSEEEKEVELLFYPRRNPRDESDEISIDTLTERNEYSFDRARDAYSHDNIDRIIDEYVFVALHPSLIDIYFPVNGFMVEVDPEEPEIGLLSRRIATNGLEKHEESLGIDADLREHLHIFDLVEGEDVGARKSFGKLKPGQKMKGETDEKMKGETDDIVIFGRIEHLYRYLIGGGSLSSIYTLAYSVLRWLAMLLPPAALVSYFALKYFFPFHTGYVASILQAIGVFVGVSFAFWTLRTFILRYILEPMYSMAKWFSYIFLAALILGKIEYLGIEFLIIFSSILVLFVCLVFAEYVRSAILYELNESFKMIGYADSMRIENPECGNEEMVRVLKCNRFQTMVQRIGNFQLNGDILVFFNSELFPKINCIRRNDKDPPREMAYSSGILPESLRKRKKSKDVNELTYGKSRAWGSWRILKNIFLDKGRIEQGEEPSDEHLLNRRHMYIGPWDGVARQLGGAVPLFPQSVLFRSMIILAATSLLIFYFLFSHELSAVSLANWKDEIGFLEVFLCVIFPSVFVLLASGLRVQFWETAIITILYFFLLIQPHTTVLLVILLTLSSILFFFLLKFPIRQVIFYSLIYMDEKLRGNIVSFKNISDNSGIEGCDQDFIMIKGQEIKKNLLFTEFTASFLDGLEEKEVLFNEDFFNNIIRSPKWKVKRQEPVQRRNRTGDQ
jgi:hypothetical protein